MRSAGRVELVEERQRVALEPGRALLVGLVGGRPVAGRRRRGVSVASRCRSLPTSVPAGAPRRPGRPSRAATQGHGRATRPPELKASSCSTLVPNRARLRNVPRLSRHPPLGCRIRGGPVRPSRPPAAAPSRRPRRRRRRARHRQRAAAAVAGEHGEPVVGTGHHHQPTSGRSHRGQLARAAERVAVTLDDQGGDPGPTQLVGARALRSPRWVQRESQRQHADRADRAGGTAGDPGSGAASSDHQRAYAGRCRSQTATNAASSSGGRTATRSPATRHGCSTSTTVIPRRGSRWASRCRSAASIPATRAVAEHERRPGQRRLVTVHAGVALGCRNGADSRDQEHHRVAAGSELGSSGIGSTSWGPLFCTELTSRETGYACSRPVDEPGAAGTSRSSNRRDRPSRRRRGRARPATGPGRPAAASGRAGGRGRPAAVVVSTVQVHRNASGSSRSTALVAPDLVQARPSPARPRRAGG